MPYDAGGSTGIETVVARTGAMPKNMHQQVEIKLCQDSQDDVF